MSTGSTTRGQLAAHYDCIKRRLDTVKLRNGLQMNLLGVAKAALEMFPIDASFPTTTLPDPDEVAELITSLLPSPS